MSQCFGDWRQLRAIEDRSKDCVKVREMTVTKESSLRSGHARAEGIVRNAKYSLHTIATGSNMIRIQGIIYSYTRKLEEQNKFEKQD